MKSLVLATVSLIGVLTLTAQGQTNSAGPDLKQVDCKIAETEQALEGTNQTPTDLVNLGAYYRIKGDLLAQKEAGASLTQATNSLTWYQKSIAVLTRAVPLDQQLNADNRRKEIAAGKKPDEFPDVGHYEIYWNIGLSEMRLKKYPEALKSYEEMRHLAPTNSDAYLSVASVYLSTDKYDEAAVALLQSLLLDSNRPEPLRLLVEVYRQIDQEGCAVIRVANRQQPQLNAECPIVKDDICRAYAGLSQVLTEARQYSLAKKTRENAINNYHCPNLANDAAPPVETK